MSANNPTHLNLLQANDHGQVFQGGGGCGEEQADHREEEQWWLVNIMFTINLVQSENDILNHLIEMITSSLLLYIISFIKFLFVK